MTPTQDFTLCAGSAAILVLFAGVPGCFFAVLWWSARSRSKATPTPRQHAIFTDLRGAIDDACRELDAVKGDSATRAHAVASRLRVLRAAQVEQVVTTSGANHIAMHLLVLVKTAMADENLQPAFSALGRALFHANTLELTFQVGHEQKELDR